MGFDFGTRAARAGNARGDFAEKAEAAGISIEDEAALFVANLIRSNVRELEGAFNRVSASSRFMNRPVIDMDLARTALQDIIAEKHKIITADTIIDATAKYYRIKISDILGKKRTRNIARPRQVAMSLTKELTTLSLPSIGDAFGGRDHTTVMHGVKAVAKTARRRSRVGARLRKTPDSDSKLSQNRLSDDPSLKRSSENTNTL